MCCQPKFIMKFFMFNFQQSIFFLSMNLNFHLIYLQILSGVRLYSTKLNDVVIVAATRTPIGSFQSSLSALSATQLGGIAIESVVKQAGINSSDVDEVLMGNVCSAGLGQAPARQAAIFGGLPTKTVCTTINKVCSSGMKSVTLAAQGLALGIQVNFLFYILKKLNLITSTYLSRFFFPSKKI